MIYKMSPMFNVCNVVNIEDNFSYSYYKATVLTSLSTVSLFSLFLRKCIPFRLDLDKSLTDLSPQVYNVVNLLPACYSSVSHIIVLDKDILTGSNHSSNLIVFFPLLLLLDTSFHYFLQLQVSAQRHNYLESLGDRLCITKCGLRERPH